MHLQNKFKILETEDNEYIHQGWDIKGSSKSKVKEQL